MILIFANTSPASGQLFFLGNPIVNKPAEDFTLETKTEAKYMNTLHQAEDIELSNSAVADESSGLFKLSPLQENGSIKVDQWDYWSDHELTYDEATIVDHHAHVQLPENLTAQWMNQPLMMNPACLWIIQILLVIAY